MNDRQKNQRYGGNVVEKKEEGYIFSWKENERITLM
jgi:hypothetical protein